MTHTIFTDTNCAYGLLGALALDWLRKQGYDPTRARFALEQCDCELGRDHTESGLLLRDEGED
jgi:hypothetical protein